jgi:hypothetical protein
VKHFTNIAVAAIVATLPLSASALSVEVIASSTQGTGNQADVFAGSFSAFLAPGQSWSGVTGAALTITPPPASSPANQSPWNNTVLGDSTVGGDTTAPDNTYFSVGPGTAPSPRILNFASAQTGFEMLWGSIDDYNLMTFYSGLDGSGTSVAYSGKDLVDTGDVAGCGTAPAFECVARVKFTDVTFQSIAFASNGTDPETDINAFEFATVPLPAAAWLLLGVSGALVGAKRRSARKAA